MGRKRIYRHDIRCPECGSNWIVKNGKQKGKQTFLCKDCHRRFTPSAERIHHPRSKKEQAIKMFCEGTSMRAIARILDVSYNTVHTWIYRSGIRASNLLEKRLNNIGKEEVEKISFDEMWTYERVRKGKKRKSLWIWTAVIETKDKKIKKVLFVGDRSEESFLKSTG